MRKYQDNYSTRLAVTATVASTVIVVEEPPAALDPGNYYVLTLDNGSSIEKVVVRAVAGSELTLDTPLLNGWNAGDSVECRVTQDSFEVIDGARLIGVRDTVVAGNTGAVAMKDGGFHVIDLTSETVFSFDMLDGQNATLVINGGNAYPVTWPDMRWVGRVPPTLTGADMVKICKANGVVYGEHKGSVLPPPPPVVVNSIAIRDNSKAYIALLPDGTVQTSNTGLDFSAVSDAVSVAGGAASAYIILHADGTVTGYGSEFEGELTGLDAITDGVMIDGGWRKTAALGASGQVYAFGDDDDGLITSMNAVTDAKWVSIGDSTGCVIHQDGTVSIFGDESDTSGITDAVMSYTTYPTAVLTASGTVHIFGNDWNGLTEAVAAWTDIKKVVMTYSGIVGLKGDGTVVYGGNGTAGEAAALGALSGVVDIVAASYGVAIVAIYADGSCTIVATTVELGDGSTIPAMKVGSWV